jgi:hypothetical protein
MPVKEKHGHAANGYSPTYRSWLSMKNRCQQPASKGWKHYGGAGIKICDRWLMFSNFLADMGERPEGKTLGRIGDTGDYEPGNCEWQTTAEQAKIGSDNGRAKLSEEQVLCIRALYAPKARRGCSATNMAADLKMSFTTIDEIVRCKTWRHI